MDRMEPSVGPNTNCVPSPLSNGHNTQVTNNNNVNTSMNHSMVNNSGQSPMTTAGSGQQSGQNIAVTGGGPQTPQSAVSGQTYSIPGIVHYLQYEWQRFEIQRQQWEVERAEFQARIALLQGERKGQENLKNDLVRRIKMLEYCLRQERAKYHKLKFGVDPPNVTPPADEIKDLNCDLEESLLTDSGQSGVNWKQGRQLLRQYLQEIGYTDTIIDVRSNRVRSLLGLNTTTSMDDAGSGVSCDGTGQKPGHHTQAQQQQKQGRRTTQSGPTAALVNEAEASVLATFEFLNEQRDRRGNDEEGDDDDDDDENEDIDHSRSPGSFVIDSETEEVLAEFDFLSAHPTTDHKDVQPSDIWSRGPGGGKSDVVDIGELAALTVANESLDMNGSVPGSAASCTEFRKTWNPKYILKSHFDCVRCLRFHATEPLLVTCSEDETLKLWNLNKTQQQSSKGKQQQVTGPTSGTTFDLEPIYTFRGHTSRVLSMAIHGNLIFSGAQNGQIIVWSIPANIANIDPYDAYDSTLQIANLEGHTNAIWSLATVTTASANPLLCSASADHTIKVWDTTQHQCIKTIKIEDTHSLTCIQMIAPHHNNNTESSASLIAASFNDGTIAVYDIESSSLTPVLTFDNSQNAPKEGSRINAITVHPTMPVIVSAHEDRQIKLWDINTGKCQNAMVAHLDEVTCIACDPNGLYVLSGSHDCSVRLWNFENRTCVQEITSHRKKFDESIFDVTFHPSKPYFASAGADALAKVFV